MSLEVAIQENTKALHALHALLSAGKPFNVEQATADAKAEAAAASAKRGTKVIHAPEPKAPAAQQGQSTAEGHVQPAAAALDYEKDIKPKALEVAKVKGNDVLRAMVAELGLAKLSDVKPERYSEVLVAIEKALA
jgi:hypothetical protein